MTTTVRQLLDEKGHKVITVGADDTVFDAVRKMAEENIGSLIVCEGSKVIGIITERHYARNVFLEGRALPNTRVGDVMETPVLFVRPDLTAEECMAVMTEKRVRRPMATADMANAELAVLHQVHQHKGGV